MLNRKSIGVTKDRSETLSINEGWILAAALIGASATIMIPVSYLYGQYFDNEQMQTLYYNDYHENLCRRLHTQKYTIQREWTKGAMKNMVITMNTEKYESDLDECAKKYTQLSIENTNEMPLVCLGFAIAGFSLAGSLIRLDNQLQQEDQETDPEADSRTNRDNKPGSRQQPPAPRNGP